MIWTTLVLALLLGVTVLILVTLFMRGTPVRGIRMMEDGDGRLAVTDDRFRHTFAALTNTAIHDGSAVRLLVNGDGTYPELWRALESARDFITWHVFWFKPGELADRLAGILVDRARAGVRVLFLYDYFGSRGTSEAYFERLREAGIEVRAFRKPRWTELYKFQQRMHVRSVVIDGEIGFTGGFAIADEWSGDGRHPDQWRDTSIRIEGPVVSQLQAAFAANWAEASGELLVGDRALSHGEAPGDTVAGVMFQAPSLGSTNAERFFMLTIAGATERLYITNSYFVPGRYFREALVDAVDRGVDVRVLTPGANSDRMSTFHAARASYEALLEAGVRIYHYRPTMLHAKTLVADGVWGAVGTINFDNRSMALNDEVVVVLHDRPVARQLEDLFRQDLEHAEEVTLEAVRSRGSLDRIKERFYLLFAPLL